MNVVFYHVGPDTRLAEIMVASARALQGAVRVIQCTDLQTPEVDGVDHVIREDFPSLFPMMGRINAFERLALREPAVYVDTDYVWKNSVDLKEILGPHDAVLCRRSWDLGGILNHFYNGLDFTEYRNMTIDQVFPILACFTITRSYKFWTHIANIMYKMELKYWRWYGDQQALKQLCDCVDQFGLRIGTIPESLVAPTPQSLLNTNGDEGSIVGIHFKGKVNKSAMLALGGV